MKFQLSVIFLVLNFVFYLSTKVSGDEKSRHQLRATAELKPNDQEIITALKDAKVSQIEKNVQQFFTIRQYPLDFVTQLNTFVTLSKESIVLSPDELTTLTSEVECVSRESRILTQVKFYRKIQELQCTNYEMLNLILHDVETALNDIAYLVHSMIAISYHANFAVGTWLWELYIKLLGLQNEEFKLDTRIFLEEHLPEIITTLNKLITSCQENNYPIAKFDPLRSDYAKGRKVVFHMYLETYKEDYAQLISDRYEFIHGKELIWNRWRPQNWLSDIAGLDFNWSIIYDLITNEIDIITRGKTSGEWAINPFKYIQIYEIILDATKARLYSCLWVHLTFYKKTAYSEDHHEELISRLNDIVKLVYIDDRTFDQVLVLLSKIFEPNDEQMINEAIGILSSEVNNFISKYTGPSHVAKIDEENIERNYGYDYSAFLIEHRKSLLSFKEDLYYDALFEFKLKYISFYINGSKTTDFVFPNKSQ